MTAETGAVRLRAARENIGDLGGILMALDAYRISLGGRPAPVIDGFTGDQRGQASQACCGSCTGRN